MLVVNSNHGQTNRLGEKATPAAQGLVSLAISPRDDLPDKPIRKITEVEYKLGQKYYRTKVQLPGGQEVELPPVKGVRIYRNDVVVVRAYDSVIDELRKSKQAEEIDELRQDDVPEQLELLGDDDDSEDAKRGKITELSWRSRMRLRFVAQNTATEFCSMLTLTYPKEYPGDGETVKRDLDTLLKRFRRQFPELEYLWVLEFQRRGAPHLHIFLNIPLDMPVKDLSDGFLVTRRHSNFKPYQTNLKLHEWVSEAWYEIVGSGDEKHLRAGCCWEVIQSTEGARRYVAKYTTKLEQKYVPVGFQNVGRFWGCTRTVSETAHEFDYADITESELRAAVGFDDVQVLHGTLFGASGLVNLLLWNAEILECDSENGVIPDISDFELARAFPA